MASVMDYLLDTLPIAAVGNELLRHHQTDDRRLAFLKSNARDLRRYLTYLPPGETRRWNPHSAGKAESIYAAVDKRTQRAQLPLIWHVDAGTSPDAIATGAVRVREMGFAAHVVFTSLRWGFADKGALKPFVVVRTLHDTAHALPLEERFLYCQFWTRGLDLPAGHHPLHPFGSPLDVSLVRCFMFDIRTNGEVTPLLRESMSAEEASEFDRTRAAWACLLEGSTIDNALAGAALFAHQAFDGRRGVGAMAGAIGDPDVKIRPIGCRILVTIAFSTSRDTFDNEPSGALAASRIRPEVYLASTTDLHGAEMSVRIQRPERTTTIASLGSVGPCHCSDMHETIADLLVADTNRIDKICSDAPLSPENPFDPNFNPMPQWGNLFAYYSVDATKTFPGRVYQLIRKDDGANKSRMGVGLVTRRPPDTLIAIGKATPTHKLTKIRFQGEFDNLHLAPRMLLKATHGRRWAVGRFLVVPTLSPETPWMPLDGRTRLDPIAMAPLCAHDCLHSHWRWGDGLTSATVMGWDARGPFRKAGAPMIPEGHSLKLSLENRHTVVWSERARDIKAGRQEVFFHFQFFYGLAADGLKDSLAPSPQMGANLVSAAQFGNMGDDGEVQPIAANSWSAMYWNFRYRLGGDAATGLFADEYHTPHDLLGAMEL